jgi:hypothetical protein
MSGGFGQLGDDLMGHTFRKLCDYRYIDFHAFRCGPPQKG